MLLFLQALLTSFAVVFSNAYLLTDGTAPGTEFHPFTLQHCTPGVSGPGNCDPVNLMFPATSWMKVRDTLREQGWTTAGFGSRHYMQFGGDVVPQDEQLFLADSANSRYHIRLWQGPGLVTYASIHHERDNLRALTHTIDADWETAEAFVAAALCPDARACSTASLPDQARIQGPNGEWRGRVNDARLSIVFLR